MKDGIETYFFSWHGFAQLRYKFWHAILAWTFVIQLCLALGVREQRIVKHLHKKEGNLRAAASPGLVSFSFKSSIDVGRQAPHAGNWQSSPKKTIDGRPKHFSGAKTRMLLTGLPIWILDPIYLVSITLGGPDRWLWGRCLFTSRLFAPVPSKIWRSCVESVSNGVMAEVRVLEAILTEWSLVKMRFMLECRLSMLSIWASRLSSFGTKQLLLQ